MILCKPQMAEFETIPELSRVLNLSAASLAGISRAQLQYTDTQHLRAEIPLLFMGRCGFDVSMRVSALSKKRAHGANRL